MFWRIVVDVGDWTSLQVGDLLGFMEPSFVYVAAPCISFSLIIVKSLQLRGHRQIDDPRKYCLVCVIVFFGVCFLYFFYFSQVGNSG